MPPPVLKVISCDYVSVHPGLGVMGGVECFRAVCSAVPMHRASVSIGNPGSLCVKSDITQVNYREHMRRSLGLKICWKMEIDETYHVASFCSP